MPLTKELETLLRNANLLCSSWSGWDAMLKLSDASLFNPVGEVCKGRASLGLN